MDATLNRSRPLVHWLPETIGPDWIRTASAQLNDPSGPIVIRGGPPTFCKGLPLELAETGSIDVPAAIRMLAEFLSRLERGFRPVIAVVEGNAIGGGVGLAAVADVVIARPEARFQLPEVILGLIPAVVMPYIARRTGWPAARRMALGEACIPAAEALRIGLVDVVTDDPEYELNLRLDRWRRAEPGALATVRLLAAGGWAVDDAIRAFTALWNGDAQTRIRRFVAGETPWEDETL
jgi:enoyl-CoA hydratase/carnithine racemase